MIVAAVLLASLASPQPLASPSPIPAATPCATHYRDARMVDRDRSFQNLVAGIPDDVHVEVAVYVNASGGVDKTEVLQTSGDFSVDNAIARKIKALQFTPKIVDCVAVPGKYTLRFGM